MKRINIPMVPSSVVAWVHNYSKKNYWKVKGLVDQDDLIAEGYYSIAYCLNKYGSNLDPPHFMRLVQLTFNCAIIDLAKKRTRLPEYNVNDLVGEDNAEAFWSKTLGPDYYSEMQRVVAESPTLIKNTLEFMMNDVSGRLREAYKLKNGERETTNARMARLMKLDQSIIEKTSLMNSVRQYLHDRASV